MFMNNHQIGSFFYKLLLLLIFICTQLLKQNFSNGKINRAMNIKKLKVQIDNSANRLLQKSIEEVSKFVKNENNKQGDDVKARLNNPMERPKETLNYQSDEQRDNVKTLKVQPKTQIKNIKNEIKMNIQKKKLFGYKKAKQQVQKLAYPPHFELIPLKGQKNVELMAHFENSSKKIIKRMMKRFKQDQSAYLSSSAVIHKISYLSQLQNKLSNAYIKHKFIEHGGLLIMQKWIDTNRISETQYEPSITVKLGILKILKNMHLSPEQLNAGHNLMKIVAKNKHSQLHDLRQLATQLIDEWQYSIMNMNKEQKNLK